MGRSARGQLLARTGRTAVRARVFALGLALFFGAVEARADESHFELQTSLDARDVWVRSMPTMTLPSPLTTPLRALSGGPLPSTGSQQFLSFAWDTTLTV